MSIYIPRRIIISILLLFVFIVSSICNNGLNITIVSMVDRDTSNSTASKKFSNFDQNKLHWDALSIATVQGAYFWGFCLTKLPGGLLSHRYGTRRVLILSSFISGIASFIFPTFAKIHPICASINRAILGLAHGLVWPSAINLGAIWIPKCERSIFSNICHGNSLSQVIFFPISGFIITRFGWESTFYLSGSLCFIWLLFWYQYAYDSPNVHPTIALEEKAYLNSEMFGTINDTIENKKSKSFSLIPWKSILTSPPFWATAIYIHGHMWCLTTLAIQIPKYFVYAHDVDIKTSGIMIGLPFLCEVLFGVTFGLYMDNIIKQKRRSITFVRKFATITSKIAAGIVLLILAWNIHSDYLFSLLLITIFYVFNGTGTSAGIANLSDIAPNFAGVITGLIQTSIGIPGILSPLLSSAILSSNPDNGWFRIFVIVALIEIFTGILFLIFGSGKVQKWNEVREKTAV